MCMHACRRIYMYVHAIVYAGKKVFWMSHVSACMCVCVIMYVSISIDIYIYDKF